MRPAARTSCPPKADSLHTCRPECIFPDVHAAWKNDLHLFRACGRETLRGFFDTLTRGRLQMQAAVLFHILFKPAHPGFSQPRPTR